MDVSLNNTSQNPLDYRLELSKEDLRTIQEANCILKLAGARRAGKNLVLMPPKAFAPGELKFDGRKNKFSEFIKTALSKMEDTFQPNEVLINAEDGVLIEKNLSQYIEKPVNFRSKYGFLKITYDNPNPYPFKSLLGENYLVDLCSANFPMSMFSFAISQGKIPDEKTPTAEESLRGTANLICRPGAIVEIFDGKRKVGQTKMGLQTTFFDKKWLEQHLIKNSDKPQDQSSDFLTSLQRIDANNFDDICNSPPAQKEDNKILLYLFLDDLEKETSSTDAAAVALQSKIKNKLQEKEIEEIKEKIQLHSLSESLNPPIYEGWGVAFNQADIDVREENEKVFLLVKIDKIFPNSKLEGVEKNDSIKIELNKQDINELKTDGKFNVGKVAKLIRGQKSLTIQKTTGIVTFEESKKSHFYKDQDDNYIGFSKSENQGKAINAIKTAFQNLLEPVVPEEGSAGIPSSKPMPLQQSPGTGTGPGTGHSPGRRPVGNTGSI